ncbi:MAG: cytidylate kinase-like family protein [Nitrospirae bacterium]|nr:cytidylate kinase-like family protein [Nitrospirota bacterium]
MSVVTIGRAAYSMGKAVAEGVAARTGYKCLGREIIAIASEEFNIPEAEFHGALDTVPSFWGMSFVKRVKIAAYLQAALAKSLLRDNIVYYGPAGAALIRGVPHVLKVRIEADVSDRARLKSQAERLSEREALKRLVKLDKNRQQLNRFLYHIDGSDASLYDMVIDLKISNTDGIIEQISSAALSARYATSTYSVNCLKNIELAGRVKAALVDIDHDITVRASRGTVFIHTRVSEGGRHRRVDAIDMAIEDVRGVEDVEITTTEDIYEKYAATYR